MIQFYIALAVYAIGTGFMISLQNPPAIMCVAFMSSASMMFYLAGTQHRRITRALKL